MLNSAEWEVFSANKSQISNNSVLLNIAENDNCSINEYENANNFILIRRDDFLLS